MSNIYCLFGPEIFIINDKLNNLIDVNTEVIKYSLNETSLDSVIEDAMSISLFSNKKTIICYDSNFLVANKKNEEENLIEKDDEKSKDNAKFDRLIKYLNKPNPDVNLYFIVETEKLDERKKIVKEFKQKVKMLEFPKMNDEQIYNYVKDIFIKNGKKVKRDAINLLISNTTGNMAIIMNEIEKLLLYKNDEEEITMADVGLVVRRVDSDNIFDLINALIDKKMAKVISIYHELIQNNLEPVIILVMLANKFRLIYQTKVLKSEGLTNLQIANMLGSHPYPIGLALDVKIPTSKLLDYLNELADLDYEIKNSNINKDVALELFLLKI